MGVLSAARLNKYHWVQTGSGRVPERAVLVGLDLNGGNLYVGRTSHLGAILPCKVAPTHHCAFLSYEGYEHRALNHEVLVLDRGEVEWIPGSNGEFPEGALPVGHTLGGETLYSARVTHEGIVTPGKLYPSQGLCYVSFAGTEHSYREYEVLTIH